MEQGLDGLLRDKTRLSCQASSVATASSQRVQMRMMGLRPPHEATHWTGRTLASSGDRTLIGALIISTNSSILWVVWFNPPE